MIQLLFTPFNNLLQADINLYFLRSPLTWLLVFLSVVFLGVLSGLYPAIKLSSGPPLAVFQAESGGRGKGRMIRRVLMVLQFSSAAILLVGIFSMQRQISYMHSQDLGFNSSQVYHMGTGSFTDEDRLWLRSWLNRFPEVEHACFSQPVPGLNTTDDMQVIDNPGSELNGLEFKLMMADLEFFDVYDLRFTQGGEIMEQSSLRNIEWDTSTKKKGEKYVINETCRKAMGLDDVVGADLPLFGHSTIVGVIEDFHFQSLEYEIKPLVIWLQTNGEPWHMSMKISGQDIAGSVNKIKRQFGLLGSSEKIGDLSIFPPTLTEITNVDETFASQYEKVERIQTASSYLSIMAVIIACLGLFGLSAFLAQMRTKEIGVRKVLGASDELIFMLLARDFLKWVSLSVLIGLPLGFLVMQKWQQQFAYKASFGFGIYLSTLVIVFVVSLLTVAWQSQKASRANPADAIRTE